MDQLARTPDFEGINFLLAPVVVKVVNSAIVGAEQNQRTAGGDKGIILRIAVAVPACSGKNVAIRGHGIFRINGKNGIDGACLSLASRTVVKTESIPAGVEHEQRPGRGRRRIAACAPDRHALIQRRELDHRIDLIRARIRREVRHYPGRRSAIPLNILDLGVSGRQRPRRLGSGSREHHTQRKKNR